VAIFARLGMHSVGYWSATDAPLAGSTLIYIMRHKSRAAATESWAKFQRRSGVAGVEGGDRERWAVCGEAGFDIYEADGFFAESLGEYDHGSARIKTDKSDERFA
jgi:hypothetical protein